MSHDENATNGSGLPSPFDGSCRVCGHLRNLLTQSGTSWSTKLGMFHEIRKVPCPGHDPLLDFIWKSYSESSLKKRADENGVEERGPYDVVVGRSEKNPYRRVTVYLDRESNSISSWDLSLAEEKFQTPGSGRILNSDWIDLGVVIEWKNACINKHQKCYNPLKIRYSSPDWLIDTTKNCLVAGHDISEYVALSYRWGRSTGFRASTDTIKQLQEVGALSQEVFASNLPPIVRHAIDLVANLEERYLWVDALCIIQDDGIHTTKQLRLMGSIYASAKFTIVVCDGDALDGIPGLYGISTSRMLDQTVIRLLDNQDAIVNSRIPTFSNISGCPKYMTRGWTYQEFCLSKRRLVFANKQVFWSCSSEEWTEDMVPSELQFSDEPRAVFNFPNIMNGQPDFRELEKLMGDYNNREFTYEEDILAGMTGILDVLSRSFEGGFLFGMPEMCFDSALMWHSLFPMFPPEERKQSGRAHSLVPISHLPSWSWMKWKAFGMRIMDEDTLDSFHHQSTITTPITQWYTHVTSDPSTGRPIQSTWFKSQKMMTDTESNLPGGWEREAFDPKLHLSDSHKSENLPESLPGYVYKHSAIPHKYFLRPVPIKAIDESVETISPLQTPYVSCETKRGLFVATRFLLSDHTEREKSSWVPIAYARLGDRKGNFCGVLTLQDPSDLPFPGDNEETIIELVAVCLQRRPTHKVSRRYGVKPGTAYVNHYGVLWIEWVDGVAYRKASGYIDQEIWEKHELEAVHLILG